MVKIGYMLDQPQPSTAVKEIVNQQIFPAVIDAAAFVEGALEYLNGQVRKAPIPSMGAAVAFGAMASVVLRSLMTRRAV